MPTTTPNLSLTKYDSGAVNWDIGVNANFDAIDTIAGTLSSNSKLNTIASSATPVINLALGHIVYIPLTQSVTSSSVTNATDGFVTFLIAQDATGGRPFVWPSNFRFAGDLSSSSSNIDPSTMSVQKFVYISSLGNFYAVSNLLTGAI